MTDDLIVRARLRDELTRPLRRVQQQVAALSAQTARASRVAGSSTSRWSSATRSVGRYGSAAASAAASSTQAARAATSAGNAVAAAGGQARDARGRFVAAGTAIGGAGQQAANAAGAFYDANGRLRDARGRFIATGQAAGQAGGMIGRLTGQARSFSLSGMIGQTSQLTGALRNAALALGAVSGAAAILGLRTGADLENAQIAFETMLGSAKAGKDMLAEVIRFAAETPFSVTGLTTSTQQLLAIGISAKDVLPIMRTLGDTTAGMGTGEVGIKRATYALQQMISSQKVYMEELNQLREAGIPVWDLLQGALGKSREQVALLARNGELGGDAVNAIVNALKTGTGLEKFNGLMERQAQTLGGLWATLKDKVAIGLYRALRPILPQIKGMLRAFQNAVPVIGRFLRAMFKGEGNWKILHRVLGVVADGIGKVIDFVKKNPEAVTAFAATIGGLVIAFAALNAVMAINPVTLVVIAVAALVGYLVHLYKTSETARAKMDAIWEALKRFGATVRDSVVPMLRDLWQTMKDVWDSGLGDKIKAVFGWFVDRVPDAIDAVGWALENVLVPYWKALGKTIEWLWKNVVNPLFVAILRHGVPAVGMLSSAFLGVADTAIQVFGWITDKLLSWVGTMLDGVDSAFGWVPGVGGKLGDAKDAFDTFRDGVTNSFDDIATTITDMQGGIDLVSSKAKTAADDLEALVKPRKGTVDVVVRTQYVNRYGEVTGGRPQAGSTPVTPAPLAGGDTATSRARGRALGLANTLAAHQRAAALAGGRVRVTNALIGGGGRGYGSGDHQAGRALDVAGPGAATYAAAIRADGGYAAFHGSGSGRHVHAVPAGDTATSRSIAGGAPARATALTMQAGAVQIVVQGDPGDLDAMGARMTEALEDWLREREERL